jgi:hypothetical protein
MAHNRAARGVFLINSFYFLFCFERDLGFSLLG